MDENKMIDAMSHIDFSLVEEAGQSADQTRRSWRRYTLIAACLCLLLAGTVLAVESGFLVKFIPGDEDLGNLSELVGFEIAGRYEATTAKRVPVEKFSQEVRALSAQLGIETLCGSCGFSTWEAAEDFLGLDVMNNPLLDSTHMGMIAVSKDEGGGTEEVRAHSIVSLYNSSETGELISVRVMGNYNVKDLANVVVSATLVTDRNPYENGGGTGLIYDTERLGNVDSQEYVTASGITASIIRDSNPVPSYTKEDVDHENPVYDNDLGYGEVEYTAFLPVGDALVMLETGTNAFVDAEESLALLKEVLDGFQTS